MITVDKLSRTYDGGAPTPALREVSFRIAQGEFTAVMGPSGSGKSTLLHILGLLDTASSGTYHLHGIPVASYSPVEAARIRNKEIGFIFQMFNLLPRTTVLRNVMLPLLYSGIPEYEWHDRAERAVESVGLTHRIGHVTSQLSGGERQRVAIARALVTDPSIILADEPTGSLDSVSGGAVMKIIQDLNERQGRTVILITHETYTAAHAGRIIRLHDGMIAEDKQVDHRHAAGDFSK